MDIEAELLAECRRIAEQTMHSCSIPQILDDIITSDKREAIAQDYFHTALAELEFIRYSRPPQNDPMIVLRAVRYLGTNAMPPIGKNPSWFRESLSTLVLIASPHEPAILGGEPFFADLRRGMDIAEDKAREQTSTNASNQAKQRTARRADA